MRVCYDLFKAPFSHKKRFIMINSIMPYQNHLFVEGFLIQHMDGSDCFAHDRLKPRHPRIC